MNWNAVILKDASDTIIKHWYSAAHNNVFGPTGKSRQHYSMEISDDDTDDDYSHREWTTTSHSIAPSTSSIAQIWLRSARARMRRHQLKSDI